MLDAIKDNTGHAPEQTLADAGYRSEDNFKALAGSSTELVVAMRREGKRCVEVDARKNPHTAAMAAKLHADAGKAAYRKRKWIAEPCRTTTMPFSSKCREVTAACISNTPHSKSLVPGTPPPPFNYKDDRTANQYRNSH